MILDDYSISQLIVQINYPMAFEMWDRIGRVTRQLEKCWPGVEVARDAVSPNAVTLKAKHFQITTGLETSTVVLRNLRTVDNLSIDRIAESFAIWRDGFELDKLTRLSTRVIYERKFSDSRTAQGAVTSLLKEKFTERVFNQDPDGDGNGLEKRWNFSDGNSFTKLSIRAEEIKYEISTDVVVDEWALDPVVVHRALIDFDRGLLKPPPASKIQMGDWVKGVIHLLRRDIEKVLKVSE